MADSYDEALAIIRATTIWQVPHPTTTSILTLCQYNHSEASRIARRKWREKLAARIANFQYPEFPWATLLLQQKVAFVQFVAGLPSSTVGTGQQHTLHQVLTMDPRKVCAIDTSCGTGPWVPYAQPPEHSRHGRDMHETSLFAYNDVCKQWEWYHSYSSYR